MVLKKLTMKNVSKIKPYGKKDFDSALKNKKNKKVSVKKNITKIKSLQKKGFVVGRRAFKTKESALNEIKSSKRLTTLVKKRTKVGQFTNPRTGKKVFIVSIKVK